MNEIKLERIAEIHKANFSTVRNLHGIVSEVPVFERLTNSVWKCDPSMLNRDFSRAAKTEQNEIFLRVLTSNSFPKIIPMFA